MASQTATERTQSDEPPNTARSNTERIAAIEAVLPFLATKADLEKLKSDLTWRIVIAISLATSLIIAVIKLPGA